MTSICKDIQRPVKIIILLFGSIISFSIFSNESTKTHDFSSVKDLLKKDALDAHHKKKQAKAKAKKKRAIKAKVGRYQVPNEDEIWNFISEYWLVKNAQLLKWDFSKPDYGLDKSFKDLLEKVGYVEKKFRILIIDSTNVPYFSLPSNPNEYILLVSLPFIRTMDLSKREISVLLLQEFFRNDMGQVKKHIITDGFNKSLGSNFYKSKIDPKIFQEVSDKISLLAFKNGFSFNEQFDVTMKMDRILKNDLELWNIYLGLLKKIENLTKVNNLYKNYNKIYPSAEMQINWLTPKAKNI